MRKPHAIQRNHDVNRRNLIDAGRLAREQDKPIGDCPGLHRYFDQDRAQLLENCWLAGWNERDREIARPRFAMKGAD